MPATLFDRILWVAPYQTVTGTALFLRVAQGGYASYYGNEDVASGDDGPCTNNSHEGGNSIIDDRGFAVILKDFVKTAGYGGWAYCPEKGTFERVHNYTDSHSYIKIGDRVAWGQASVAGIKKGAYWHLLTQTGCTWYGMQWASFGNLLIGTYGSSASSGSQWSYPFTTPPGAFGVIGTGPVCVHNGKFYSMSVNATTGFTIYEYSSGIWVSKITQSDRFNSALGVSTFQMACCHALIPYDGYLWAFLGHANTGSAEMVTLWRVDPVAWTAVEKSTTHLPDGTGSMGIHWRGVTPYAAPLLGQVPYTDTNGVLRYLVIQTHQSSYPSAGWSVIVFDPTNADSIFWTEVALGAQTLAGAKGVIWDIDAGNDQIVDIVDHGTYVSIKHRCSHPNNKPIDVGIRYQTADCDDNDGIPCTPYTGDPAHEGDTGLTTKPTEPANLAALSDTFDGDIDESKYMKCNAAVDWTATGAGWYGLGGRSGGAVLRTEYPIVQQAGGVYFGTTPQITEANSGAALALRWMMSGDVTVDLTLDRLSSLAVNASEYTYLFGVLLETTNRGWGFAVRSISGSNYYGVGFYFQQNAICVKQTGTTRILADNDVMRLSRTAGGISIIAGYGSSPEDITPATPPTLSDPVQLIFGASTRSAITWAGAVLGPGYKNLAISGGGALSGAYRGYVEHTFCWDALADLGAVNKGVHFLSYFKRNTP